MFSLKKKLQGPTIFNLKKAYYNTKAQTVTNRQSGIKKQKNLNRIKSQIKNKALRNKTIAGNENVKSILNSNLSLNKSAKCEGLRVRKANPNAVPLSKSEEAFLLGCKLGAGVKYAGGKTRNAAMYAGGKARNAAMKAGKKISQKGSQMKTGYIAYKAQQKQNKVQRRRNELNTLKQQAQKAQNRFNKRRMNVGLVPRRNNSNSNSNNN